MSAKSMRMFSLFVLLFVLLGSAASAQDSCIASQLTAGGFGRITPGEANNVRADPSPGSERVGQIPGGAPFAVTASAVCEGSRLWVEVMYADFTGWTVEANGTDVWVVPYDAESYEDDVIRFIYPSGYLLELTAETIPEQYQMGGFYPTRQEYLLSVTEDEDINRYFQAIEIMPTAGITDEAPLAFESLQKLRLLLPSPPELSGPILEITDQNMPQEDIFLPSDPLFLGARRTLVSSARLITLQNGSGVAFVTMYSQDVLPIYNDGLFYNVLALTDDGTYFVVLRLPVRTDAIEIDSYFEFYFPDDWQVLYPQHIEDMTNLLDSLSPDEWDPSLDTLSAIAASIYIKGDIPQPD